MIEHAKTALLVALEFSQCAAIYVLGCDLLKLMKRVDETEFVNEREDAEERKLEDQDRQLREELDGMHKALKSLAKHLPKDNLTRWRDDNDHTVAGVPTPLPELGATQVFSPGAPKLPRFALLACGHPIGECPGGPLCQLTTEQRDTIIEQLWDEE